MLKSSLCDYSDSYILVKWNITVNNTLADDDATINANEELRIVLTDCMNE